MPRLFSRQPYPSGTEAFQCLQLALQVPGSGGAILLRPREASHVQFWIFVSHCLLPAGSRPPVQHPGIVCTCVPDQFVLTAVHIPCCSSRRRVLRAANGGTSSPGRMTAGSTSDTHSVELAPH